jgi:hypothetical protein
MPLVGAYGSLNRISLDCGLIFNLILFVLLEYFFYRIQLAPRIEMATSNQLCVNNSIGVWINSGSGNPSVRDPNADIINFSIFHIRMKWRNPRHIYNSSYILEEKEGSHLDNITKLDHLSIFVSNITHRLMR